MVQINLFYSLLSALLFRQYIVHFPFSYFQINKIPRTKVIVLELLTTICLVKGGHSNILTAFDNVKQELREGHRFETLMHYFSHCESFENEFMVACMNFINIVVHSVEDMNFRVALQWEFSNLGIKDCLDKLRNHESEELDVQISSTYLISKFKMNMLNLVKVIYMFLFMNR